jgi:tetratricopeptide (TPR) repeat protein
MKPFTGRSPAVMAGLTILAVLGLVRVGRLVNRFQEQQKALACHLDQRGFEEQQSGKLDLAVQHFRAALAYDPDNFQHKLSLARSLRDSGRVDEAEAYLISLWERFAPERCGKSGAREISCASGKNR